MSSSRRLSKLLPALVLVALAIPTSASAQATRTWVSGVGDDANPCSRTAPCKTFAGAISKTAASGEINVLDPGGFGAVTITKSITIRSDGFTAGVLVSGTNGIIINAGASDKVSLRGLDVNGLNTGLSGVKVLSAARVDVTDSDIFGFQQGIQIVPTNAQTRVVVKRSDIHNNKVGVLNTPGSNAIQFTVATLRNNNIQDNLCGVVVGSFGAASGVPTATQCGVMDNTSTISKTATMQLYHNGINLNQVGVFARGNLASAEIAWNEIANNDLFGIERLDASTVRTLTPATNVISGNGASDAPNATQALTKRAAKRLRH